MVRAHGDDDSVYVRYQVDVWVEVAADGEVAAAIVDSDTLAQPVDAIRGDRSPITGKDRTAAIDVAQSGLWPSWDFGVSPAAIEKERAAGEST